MGLQSQTKWAIEQQQYIRTLCSIYQYMICLDSNATMRGRDTERSHELPEPLNKSKLKARTLSRAPRSLFRVFSTIGSVSFHWCVCIFLCWRGHRCSPAFFFFITLSKTYFLFVISLFHPGHLITFLWAVSAIFWRKKKKNSVRNNLPKDLVLRKNA